MKKACSRECYPGHSLETEAEGGVSGSGRSKRKGVRGGAIAQITKWFSAPAALWNPIWNLEIILMPASLTEIESLEPQYFLKASLEQTKAMKRQIIKGSAPKVKHKQMPKAIKSKKNQNNYINITLYLIGRQKWDWVMWSVGPWTSKVPLFCW